MSIWLLALDNYGDVLTIFLVVALVEFAFSVFISGFRFWIFHTPFDRYATAIDGRKKRNRCLKFNL